MTKAEQRAEYVANDIMVGVQANKYHTAIYNTDSNDFNHSHLKRAALEGYNLALEDIKEEVKRRMFEDYNGPDQGENEIAQGVCASVMYFIDSLAK